MKNKLDTDTYLLMFVILLMVFIAGVQVGIKHGRTLKTQEFLESGYEISN